MDKIVNYEHFMCRLCLCKSGNLVDIHSCKVGGGLIVADAISDLLQLEVSVTDCYPKLACSECLNQLHEFQNFKDSCWRAKTNFETIYSNTTVSDVTNAERKHDGEVNRKKDNGKSAESCEEHRNPCTEECENDKNLVPVIYIKEEPEIYIREEGEHNGEVNRTVDNGESRERREEHPNSCTEELVNDESLVPEIDIKEESIEEPELKDPLCLESSESNIREILEEELTIKEEEIQLNERQTIQEAPVTSVDTAGNTSTQGIYQPLFGNTFVMGTMCPGTGFIKTLDSSPFLPPAGYLVLNVQGSMPTNSYLGLVTQNGINYAQGMEMRTENTTPVSNEIATKETKKKSSAKYQCQHCSKKYPSDSHLASHICAALRKKDFECKGCGEKFQIEKDLWNHLKNHKLNFHFNCKVCGKEFPSEDKLYQHFSEHKNESLPIRPFPVLVPDPIPPIPSGVVVNDEGQIQSSDEKGVVFPNVNVQTSSVKEQVKDAESETKSGVHCPFCGRFCINDIVLTRHIYEVHSERKFECNICHKKFRTEKCVERHASLHSANRPYRCEVCGKGFFNKNSFSRHASYHAGDVPFQCDRCGRKCTHKRPLWKHIGSCYKTKTYECSVCKKKFTTQSYLSVHMTIHTGEKKHTCDVCGKSFRGKNTLLTHRRQHTGERPYSCDICNKSFIQRTSYVTHIKRYHRA